MQPNEQWPEWADACRSVVGSWPGQLASSDRPDVVRRCLELRLGDPAFVLGEREPPPVRYADTLLSPAGKERLVAAFSLVCGPKDDEASRAAALDALRVLVRVRFLTRDAIAGELRHLGLAFGRVPAYLLPLLAELRERYHGLADRGEQLEKSFPGGWTAAQLDAQWDALAQSPGDVRGPAPLSALDAGARQLLGEDARLLLATVTPRGLAAMYNRLFNHDDYAARIVDELTRGDMAGDLVLPTLAVLRGRAALGLLGQPPPSEAALRARAEGLVSDQRAIFPGASVDAVMQALAFLGLQQQTAAAGGGGGNQDKGLEQGGQTTTMKRRTRTKTTKTTTTKTTTTRPPRPPFFVVLVPS